MVAEEGVLLVDSGICDYGRQGLDRDNAVEFRPTPPAYSRIREIHRALPEKELTARYRAFCAANGRSVNRIYDASDVRQALSMAINLARETSRMPDSAGFCFPLIYVGGSTYLVSEAVQILKSLQL